MSKFREMDKKRRILLIVIGVLIVAVGVTLAYVVAQLSSGAIGNANVTSDTTDNLQFSVSKDISLNPTQFNVTEGGGGLSDTAVGTATLLANSTTNSFSTTYYVYFNINSNNYIYTTEEQKPEIVLTITDPTGQPVTEVSGLTYVNAENADGTVVSGFDITTKTGMLNIASDYAISSTSSTNATVQNWTFTVTFINLTTNQTDNGGKTLSGELILSREVYRGIDLSTVYTYTTSNSVKVRALSNDADDYELNYYYSIDGGDNYVGPVSTNSYTFTEGITPETTYDVSVYAEDTYGNASTIYNASVTTKDTIDEQYTLSSFNSLSSYYGQITSIIFEKGTEGHSGATATFDMSETQNGLIIGYLMADGTLYIQAAKTIVLSSTFLDFDNIEWIYQNNVARIGGDNVNFPSSIPSNTFAGWNTIFDWKNWDFSGLTTIGGYLFSSYRGDYIDWSNMNVSSLTSISGSSFSVITADYVDLSGWDTSSLTTIGSNAFALLTADYIDLSGWDTSSLTRIDSSAFGMIKAEYVDLRGWDLTNVDVGENAFYDDGTTGTVYYVSNEATKEKVERYGATAIIME